MTKRRAQRNNNIHLLTGQQRAELAKYQKDFTQALPHMQALAQTAKQVHQAIIDAPVWRLAETPKPDNVEEPKPWTVGHAKVNYVDKIEHEGAQEQ